MMVLNSKLENADTSFVKIAVNRCLNRKLTFNVLCVKNRWIKMISWIFLCNGDKCQILYIAIKSKRK